MGTSKPLTILVHPDYFKTPWAEALREKGHVVAVLNLNLEDVDLILAPNCARFVPGSERFLTSFLAGARTLKYPGKKKDA